MSRATQEATIERSFTESTHEDLGSPVDRLYQRLLEVMKEEAELRASIKSILDQEEVRIMEEYRRAEENVKLFKARREKIWRDTKRNRTPSLVGYFLLDLINTERYKATPSRTRTAYWTHIGDRRSR